jgi:hypothetical protein
VTALIESETETSVTSPTIRRATRRGLFWFAVVAILLLVMTAALAARGSQPVSKRLDPANPAPIGAKAVAQVLRSQGVTVTNTATLASTEHAVTDAPRTTIALYDPDGLLAKDQLDRLAALGTSLVLIEPNFATLAAIAPRVKLAGIANDRLTADCSLGPVQRAGTVVGAKNAAYRAVGDKSGITSCLGSGSDNPAYAVIQVEESARTVTVVGVGDAFTNERVAAEGNAALTLSLLGQQPSLVWYLPTLADVESSGPPTLAELSPPWLIPVIALLGILIVSAAVWRGRRFGPLVVENLPVIVRASETMEGRARLYQKGSARVRALDSLRIGSIDRLALTCGLPRLASVDDVVGAVASATGRPADEVRSILVDTLPRNDRDLVELSDELLTLERETRTATQPH